MFDEYSITKMAADAITTSCALYLLQEGHFDDSVQSSIKGGIKFCNAVEEYTTPDNPNIISGNLRKKAKKEFFKRLKDNYSEKFTEFYHKTPEVKADLEKLLEQGEIAIQRIKEITDYFDGFGQGIMYFDAWEETCRKEIKAMNRNGRD